MSVLESDFDLLEEYLDGALSGEQAMALRARLSDEPELASALAVAKEHRAVRATMFGGMEADAATVERLLANVLTDARPSMRGADRRSNPLATTLRFMRFAAAAAACIVIGFFLGRTHAPSPAAPVPAQQVEAPRGYQVSVTDGAGKVLAVQTFDTLQKAQDFARDLDDWQQRQQLLKNGQPVQVADQF